MRPYREKTEKGRSQKTRKEWTRESEAYFGLAQKRQEGLGHPHGAHHVHVHLQLDLPCRLPLSLGENQDGRVVDQGYQGGVTGRQDGVYGGAGSLDLGLVGHVKVLEDVGAHLGQGLGPAVRVRHVATGNHRQPKVLEAMDSQGKPEAGVAAGDEDRGVGAEAGQGSRLITKLLRFLPRLQSVQSHHHPRGYQHRLHHHSGLLWQMESVIVEPSNIQGIFSLPYKNDLRPKLMTQNPKLVSTKY